MSMEEWETDKLLPIGAQPIDSGHRFRLTTISGIRRMACERCGDPMNERCAILATCPGRILTNAEYIALGPVPRAKKKR